MSFCGDSTYLQISNLLLCAQGSLATANGGKRWQVGDVCMAKYWQDNEVHYFAVCKKNMH